MKPEVLILLSGGIDSTALVKFYLDLGRPAYGLFIDYKQPAAKEETTASKNVAEYFSLPLIKASWKGNTEIRNGYINGRNNFLISAALMESLPSISVIAIGIHSGTNYPDCSTLFMDKMQDIVSLYSNNKIHISAPFINWDKSELLLYATQNNIPFELTYSCENGGPVPCGNCLSCRDREVLNACSKKNA